MFPWFHFINLIKGKGINRSGILVNKGRLSSSFLCSPQCAALCVERQATSAYHPETNGLVEMLYWTLIRALRKAAEKFPQDWLDFLP